MRAFILVGLVSLSLAGCYSRTVEEKPVMVPQPQSHSTVVVPPGSTVICPAGQSC